jgi:hypothetical protein
MKTLSLNKSIINSLIILFLFLIAFFFFISDVQAKQGPAPGTFAAGDIQFCPKGKAYLDTSCSTLRTTMAAAIQDALDAAAIGVSGTIYIENGNYSNTTNDNTGGMVDVEDFDYGTSLVFQGGVGGGTTTFVRSLLLYNNDDLDITLNGISIDTSTGSDEGIWAFENTGKIVLNNISTHSSVNRGIAIYNHTGDVVINDVTSNNNNGEGIYLDNVSGSVDLENVTADGNGSINIVVST